MRRTSPSTGSSVANLRKDASLKLCFLPKMPVILRYPLPFSPKVQNQMYAQAMFSGQYNLPVELNNPPKTIPGMSNPLHQAFDSTPAEDS